jgi:hypothetical protein
MERKNTSIRKILKRKLYQSLIYSVDFTEYIYLRLKYFKNNYKSVLSDIFEEKDKSIDLTFESNWPENKYLKYFLNVLLSLFAYQIPEAVQLAKANCKVFYKSDFRTLASITKANQNRWLFHFSTIVLLLILASYAFT